jgi:hypothetical protein
MRNLAILAYAGLAYLLAIAYIGYIVAFLADFGVPKTVNSGTYDGALWRAVAINAALGSASACIIRSPRARPSSAGGHGWSPTTSSVPPTST